MRVSKIAKRANIAVIKIATFFQEIRALGNDDLQQRIERPLGRGLLPKILVRIVAISEFIDIIRPIVLDSDQFKDAAAALQEAEESAEAARFEEAKEAAEVLAKKVAAELKAQEKTQAKAVKATLEKAKRDEALKAESNALAAVLAKEAEATKANEDAVQAKIKEAADAAAQELSEKVKMEMDAQAAKPTGQSVPCIAKVTKVE